MQAARDGKRYVTLFLTGDDTLQASTSLMTAASREYGTLLKRPVMLCSGSRFGTPQGATIPVRDDRGVVTEKRDENRLPQ